MFWMFLSGGFGSNRRPVPLMASNQTSNAWLSPSELKRVLG
jgi:hypothetical protein